MRSHWNNFYLKTVLEDCNRPEADNRDNEIACQLFQENK